MKRCLAGLLAVVAAVGLMTLGVGAAGASGTLHVLDFGAVPNGTTNDTPAVNKAIVAANAAGGGTVLFPAGKYLAGGSIHLLSNVTVDLAAGSEVLGASGGYDAPEPNPFSQY